MDVFELFPLNDLTHPLKTAGQLVVVDFGFQNALCAISIILIQKLSDHETFQSNEKRLFSS